MTPATGTEQSSPVRPPAQAGGVPAMREEHGRHALAEDVGLVTGPEAEQDTGPEPVTRDAEAFNKLAEDLKMRRVLWLLNVGYTWPWLLDSLTTPAARNRAIWRGLVARPVGEGDDVLMPYHLTDAGRAHLLEWVEAITPHKHLREVAALWFVVTTK